MLVFTGKGGVGKTTVAAATAVRCAALGQRTLVISTDPAHSLGDVLGRPVGDQPTNVGTRLDAQQLDARLRLEASWGELRRYLSGIIRWAGVSSIETEELMVLPGLGEVLALADLVDRSSSGSWDTIVVDCAPTAETLRLLSLPDVLGWWMAKLFPIGRRLSGAIGPVVQQLVGLPVADEAVFAALERLHRRLAAAKVLLADSERTSVRLVLNPDALVVAESRRTATYLALFGLPLDGVIVNRLLPDEVTDPWFDEWKVRQAVQLKVIEEGFSPVPILQSAMVPVEPIGRVALGRLAKGLYGRRDPRCAMYHGRLLSVVADPRGWRLDFDLPFGQRGDVDVVRRDGELIVSIGPYRRSIVLPDTLRDRRVLDATFGSGHLSMLFEP